MSEEIKEVKVERRYDEKSIRRHYSVSRKIWKVFKILLRHLFLAALGLFWLIPIIWMVLTAFSTTPGVNFYTFFPDGYTLDNFKELLFSSSSSYNFPKQFLNTLIIASIVCVISTSFVLMVAYAMSCMRFKARKPLMNFAVTLNLFPGFLSMIAVYFILKSIGLTKSHLGLVLVYSASSGLGYLVVKGFFDTISKSLREAAKIEGASELQIFTRVVMPLAKPIIVYTIISSFLGPWMDFIYAKIILLGASSSERTVAIGLYAMLDRALINQNFAKFCAGGLLVSIPISILYVIMQKFYVEGITAGGVKG